MILYSKRSDFLAKILLPSNFVLNGAAVSAGLECDVACSKSRGACRCAQSNVPVPLASFTRCRGCAHARAEFGFKISCGLGSIADAQIPIEPRVISGAGCAGMLRRVNNACRMAG